MCGTNDVSVDWLTSAAPLNYTAAAVPLSGNISVVTCHSSSGSCMLSDLQCGHTYNVSVKASSGSCCGAFTHPQTVETGNKYVDDVRMVI